MSDPAAPGNPFRLSRGLGSAVCVLAVLAAPAHATDVVLAGVFPGKALLVINGGAPRALQAGAVTPEGVRVVSVDAESAIADFDGQRHRLFVGQHAVSVGRDKGSAPLVMLEADGRGMFRSSGRINGASVQFVVDTGATFVALGRSDAQRLGLDLTRAEPIAMQTANGVARGWKLPLDSVSIGGITLRNVEGVVHSSDLPVALLGMSFLNRMEMRREGSTMQLLQRF
ncbi:MAG: TIGR02281 family clan AA aspartic protease [Zoogloea sp.]|uniref:retropepsin-like aspartic protease family protein n=1 Tax=Zoogloea sp. TaxID=49181 RepID=UPI002614D8B5|nr:TIGR02281 family clan AA aspartic protease [Zoogloea sp.]MDD3325459.1 TIGR02281 family clan AA aspartic protease [Zoogloea sp.]